MTHSIQATPSETIRERLQFIADAAFYCGRHAEHRDTDSDDMKARASKEEYLYKCEIAELEAEFTALQEPTQ